MMDRNRAMPILSFTIHQPFTRTPRSWRAVTRLISLHRM